MLTQLQDVLFTLSSSYVTLFSNFYKHQNIPLPILIEMSYQTCSYNIECNELLCDHMTVTR